MSEQRALPLAGLMVLELGHIVAGPTAGQLLADMGADVIKIEGVDGGDQVRNWPGPGSAAFSFFNRNKRSLALNLKGEGREVFLDLASKADVIVDNFAFGAIDRLGIGFDVVAARNPRVIWMSIKGFLPGPLEAQPMLDELAQMAGGLAFMTGLPGQPMRAGASIIDICAATYGVVGVLGALRQREQDGRGQYITAGLYETVAYIMGQSMASAQSSGQPSQPMSVLKQGTRMGFDVYRLFDSADGVSIFVGVTSAAHWERFCKSFERPDLLTDPRFADREARMDNQAELNGKVAEIIAGMKSEQALARLAKASIPFAPVRRPDELDSDPHLIASGQLPAHRLADGRTAHLPKMPIKASGFEMDVRRDAPALGAHTREILSEFGYSAEKIESLKTAGVIGVTDDSAPA